MAISTTGDEHRLGFLETSVRMWHRALPLGADLFVTVDGDEAAAARVVDRLSSDDKSCAIYRVGQPDRPRLPSRQPREGRLGVAANKNTGIELLTDAGVEDLFLCDDDTYPLYSQSVTKHIDFIEPHSMVCWGRHRFNVVERDHATWTWPRGVMLYTHRSVIEEVGGMDERFGPGGHEHVEWSRRIHQAGFTAAPFISPTSYATRNGMGAAALWHCEDMRRAGEPLGNHKLRRRQITSVRRTEGDWNRIEQIMALRDGDTSYVPFRAQDNGRLSATLSTKSL